MDKSYASMSLDELEAEQQRLSAERDKIREQQLAVKAAYDEKAAAAKAESVLAGLTPGQVDAVAKAAAVMVKSSATEVSG